MFQLPTELLNAISLIAETYAKSVEIDRLKWLAENDNFRFSDYRESVKEMEPLR